MKLFVLALTLALFDGQPHPAQADPVQQTASVRDPGLDPDRSLIVDPSGALSSNKLNRVGWITIQGQVHTDKQRSDIETRLRSQRGIKNVRNELQVVPAPKKKNVQRTED